MATRLERAQETLKREEKKSDLKRLGQARDHLRAAIVFLEKSFHDSEFERYVDEVRPRIAEPTQQLTVIIEGE